MSALQLYEVIESGFILGTYRKAGEKIKLHPRQALYLMAPHGSQLKPAN
ncbi:hypothetical protein ACO2I3_12365 [Leptospira interrogans]